MYITYVCVSGGKKCLIFGNFGVLCFLETPVLRFVLLPYFQRFDGIFFAEINKPLLYFDNFRIKTHHDCLTTGPYILLLS